MKTNCRVKDNRAVFVFEEKRSKLSLNNRDRVESERIKVDGCDFEGQGSRCDYLHKVEDKSKELAIFIELKGQDLNQAYRQIEAGLQHYAQECKGLTKKAYIICTRVPVTTTEVQKLKLNLMKHWRTELIVQSSPHTASY